MAVYILRRLLQAVPLLVGVSIAGFVLLRLAPGGPMAVYAQNPSMSEAAVVAAWLRLPPRPRLPAARRACSCLSTPSRRSRRRSPRCRWDRGRVLESGRAV